MERLRQTAEDNKGKVAQWWGDVQKSWDEQIASIRREVDLAKAEHDVKAEHAVKAEHDVKAAQRTADSAEEDAEFAVRYTYWAVEEAECAMFTHRARGAPLACLLPDFTAR